MEQSKSNCSNWPKGKELKLEDLPPSNLVFLIDVSGSMQYVTNFLY